VAPLFEKALSKMADTLRPAGLDASDLLRVTCSVTSLQDVGAVRERASRENPRAVWNFIQRTREPAESRAECEAVARLRTPPSSGLVRREGLAETGPGPLVLTGLQLAFGRTEADARLAFQRLTKTLETAGTGWNRAAVLEIYPLSAPMAALARLAQPEAIPGSALPVEGLPSLDATFGMDAVAVP
jgi:enamine deaminase RidA (YjgF/YER057c/UK114 family)